MKELLIKLLKLDPAATDDVIVQACQKLADDNASLKAAADASKAEADTATAANAATEVKLANERKARIDILLTQAVGDGRVTPAGKPAWEKNLNEDFGKFSVALANEKPAMKTESQTAGRTPGGADQSVQGKILALVNEAKSKGLSHDAAFAQVKASHAALFALPA